MDSNRKKEYFNTIAKKFPITTEVVTIVVTHLLLDRSYFLEGISSLTSIVMVIPKIKSIHKPTEDLLKNQYNIQKITREEVSNVNLFLSKINKDISNKKVVILDVGGYFAKSYKELNEKLNGNLIGIIEDTENGLQKYKQIVSHDIPIISVARSPLKNSEDYLVGHSIVFSTEALLREIGDILSDKNACVIGYGKIGRSIAHLLNLRYVNTIVYDTNPIICTEAMSHGFNVSSDLKHAVKNADLIFCATGNLALKENDFKMLKNGAYISTVTSADDELELDKIKKTYTIRTVSDMISECRNQKHKVYLLNRGQAVNFVHGASVGSFIFLVQAEIIASISKILLTNDKGIIENDEETRKKIAKIWLDTFNK